MRELIKNIIQEELERSERSKEYEKIDKLLTKKYGKEWWSHHRLRDDIEAILGDNSEIEDIASYYYMDRAIDIWNRTKDPQKVANAVQYAYTHAPDTYQSVRKFLTDKGFVLWGDRSSYTFNDKKKSRLILKLTNFIQEPTTIPKTRKNFLNRFGYAPFNQGFLSEFFATAKRSEIVAIDKKTYEYKLGPNYDAWVEGKLIKLGWFSWGPATVGSF